MTTYTWPASFGVNAFEMCLAFNTRVFVSPFTKTAQVIDYTGERWQATIGLVPGNSAIKGAAQEAFFDRLNGPLNRIALWNLRRPVPLGTLRGTPTNAAAIAQGAGTTTLQATAGETVKAGDHIGLANGQNVRIMADAVADGSGLMPIEFRPRARSAISISGAIVWDKPLATFMLKADGVPVQWRPGIYDGTSFELIESL